MTPCICLLFSVTKIDLLFIGSPHILCLGKMAKEKNNVNASGKAKKGAEKKLTGSSAARYGARHLDIILTLNKFITYNLYVI